MKNTARILWKLAKVEELIQSSDGVVRSTKIRVLNNDNRKPIILRRPLQHLIPLEVRSNTNTKEPARVEQHEAKEIKGDSEVEESDNHGQNNVVEKHTRPRRNAAVQGELFRKWSNQT